MNNGFKNTFGGRIEYLMKHDGIEINRKGADTALAKRMLSNGYLFYDNQDKKKALDSARSRITLHRKTESAANVEGKWLKAYCDYFHCSADFLFGYIDQPTHTTTDIYKETGLSLTSIKLLKSHTVELFPILDKLISLDTFRYALFHVKKYSHIILELRQKHDIYLSELERIDAYSQKTEGNYNGESETEREYHKLMENAEIQAFRATKYFEDTIDKIKSKHSIFSDDMI